MIESEPVDVLRLWMRTERELEALSSWASRWEGLVLPPAR